MIPTALAILIYQILAILGTDAVTQIVTYIAYKRRDLDFKLMYTQSPLDLLLNYSRFDKKLRQKAAITVFVCLSIVLKFIPTILTNVSSADIIYYGTDASALDTAQADKYSLYHFEMPAFGNIVSYLTADTQSNDKQTMLKYIMENYINATLGSNTEPNSKGHWFQLQPNFKPFAWDDRQIVGSDGIRAFDAKGQELGPKYNAFGVWGSRVWGSTSVIPSSATLQECDPENRPDTNNVLNLTATHGLQVSYVKGYGQVCYPIYDPSLSVIKNNYRGSRLDENDRNYRRATLLPGKSASSSFAVNLVNHNSTHMTMGVKKSFHTTLYGEAYDKVIPPSDCSSEGKPDFANNFSDLPYNAVLCDLFTHINNKSLQPAIVQAVGRKWIDNYAINTVYTVLNSGMSASGLTVMIDFTMFQAFTVEGNVWGYTKEYMVAYQEKNTLPELPDMFPKPGETKENPVDFSNDKIGALIKETDPSYLNQVTIDILVGVATMTARFSNDDFSFLELYQAQVVDAVRTPLWWILTVAALALVFLLPQACRLMVKHVPEYSKDLRSLMLLSIGRTHVLGDVKSVNNVSLAVNEELYHNKPTRVARLAVNGHRVTVGEKVVDGLNARLLDEEMDGSSSEQHLTDRR